MSPFPFNTTTPLFTINRAGWLGLGSSRLILMDALGGFRTLREQIAQELGQEAESDMAQRAGHASAERLVTAGLGSGDITRDEAGFRAALSLMTAGGYGSFSATEVRLDDHWAKVSVDNSVEGWMFRESGGRISAGCDYIRGLLAGVMHHLTCSDYRNPGESDFDAISTAEAFPDHPAEAPDAFEISCIETSCIATGEDTCQFVLGPATLLLADGFTPVYAAQSSVRETLLRLNRQLEQILDTSRKDSLTKLYNRSHFEQSLRQRIGYAKRRSDVVSLAIIDVDSFKSINDSQGHSVGDRVLRQVARTLENQAREDDVVARLGGDEFVWLMPATVGETALLVAQRLRKTIADLAPTIGFGVNVSIGVASYPQDAGSPTELYEHADAALFTAKRGGRDQAVRYGAPEARQSSTGNSAPGESAAQLSRRALPRDGERPLIRNGENMYTYGIPPFQATPPARPAAPDTRAAAPAQPRSSLQNGSDSRVDGRMSGSRHGAEGVAHSAKSLLLEAVSAPGRPLQPGSKLERDKIGALSDSRRFGKKKRY